MSNYLTKEQVNQLNEKHGWFEFGDAQSDVSMAFAQDAITMYLAATEAAKATGTAEFPPHDGYIDLYDESGRIGRVTSEKAWLETSVLAYGQQCAEAARQPAPVVAVKTWQERRKEHKEPWHALPPPDEWFMRQEIHDLRAALAATAAPVLSDDQKRDIENCIHDGSIRGAISDSTLDAMRAILARSQP